MTTQKRKRLTRGQIADRAEISRGLFYQYLSGARKPNWDHAKKLADMLGTTPNTWMDQNLLKMNVAVVRYQYQQHAA